MEFFKHTINMKSYCPHDHFRHAVKLIFAAAIFCFSLTEANAQCPIPGGASNISGADAVCPGDVATYTVLYVANRTYIWTAPAGSTITGGQGTNSITVAYTAGFTASGNICVALSNGCATSLTRCKTILRNIPPSVSNVNGPQTVCGGQSAAFSVATHPSATSYVWTIPAGCTIAGQGSANVTVNFPAGFIYGKVSARYANGCSTSGAYELNVRSVPATPSALSGIYAGLCNGSASYSTPAIAGTTSYGWSFTGGASVTTGQGTDNITASFPSNFNIGKVCVVATNQCGNGTPRCMNLKRDIEIISEPTNQLTCENSSAVFTVTAMGLNLNYQWRKNGVALSNGGSISGAQTSALQISPSLVSDNGNYDVVVTNNCSPNKTSTTASLIVNTPAQAPASISGGSPVTCPGTNNVVYTLPLQPDAYAYQWMTSDGATIVSGQGTNSVTINFASTNNSGYYISAKAINQCGISTDSVRTWTRYSISSPAFVAGPSNVCQGQQAVGYEVQNIAGATSYAWTAPAGASIASGQGTNSVTVNFSPLYSGGTLSVTASNQCYTTAPKNLVVGLDIPSTPSTITGSSYSACNVTLNHTTPHVNGAASYTWQLPAGATLVSGAGTNNVDIAYANVPAGSQVCVTANSICNSSPARCITVKSIPITPASISCSVPVVCRNQTGVVFTAPVPPVGSTVYYWTVPQGSVIVSGQNTNSITVNMGVNNGNVGVSGSNSCGSSGTRTYQINMSCREGGTTDFSAKAEDLNSVTVYPNPAQTISTVTFGSVDESQYTIQLFDMLGNIVFTEGGISKPGINKHEINLSQLPKGVYLLLLKKNDGVKHLKVQVK